METEGQAAHTGKGMPLCAILCLAALLPAPPAAEDSLPAHVLLLRRIKDHMRAEIERQPDYTCLETTERRRHEAGQKGPPQLADTLLLEVLTTTGKELYASPGARDFAEESPTAFAVGGMSGTGAFSLHARALFVNDLGLTVYRGEEDLLGRRAVRYDYRVPELLSGWTLRTATASGRVGMKGSFWADPKTLDVIRLRVEASEIPPRLGIASHIETIDYARTRISGGDILLPQSVLAEMAFDSGAFNRNISEFTHCRAFSAESRISFDEPAPPPGGGAAKRAPDELRVVPEGLVIAVELTSTIAATDPIGKPVEGRVAADVIQKRKVIVPAGAKVRGRLRRLERHADFGAYFAVGLEFTEIELPDGPARFYATLQDMPEKGPIQFILERPAKTKANELFHVDQLYLPYVAGVASFFVKGDRLIIPPNLRTVWRTRTPR